MNGLELDKRFDQSNVQPVAEEEHKYPYHLPDGLQVSYEYDQKPSSSQARRVCWLRPTTFILSVAIASVTVLAIVAAAVGGSLAAKELHAYQTLIEDLERLRKLIILNSTGTVGHPSSSSNPQNFNNACPVANLTTSSPTDDCTKLFPTYVSSLSKVGSTTLRNTAFHNYNILGVFAYRFEDCMEACASFNHFQSSNTTCYGVTFDMRRPQQGGKGNCFLKDMHGIFNGGKWCE